MPRVQDSAHPPEEANKTVVDRVFDAILNDHDPDATSRLVARDFVAHHPAFPDGIHGPEGMAQVTAMFRGAFPDLIYTIEDRIAEEDKVVVRWTAGGTHRAPFLGLAATGNAMRITGTDIFRVRDGMVAEAWVVSDFFGLFVQLGAFPPMPQRPAR